MPALLTRISRRPNFCAAPLTKSRHAASVPTSACVKAILAPAVSSSAATRWPRSPSRSQNATLAPSATKRLTVASPIPDAPPVTAATLPSSLPMFATFHCIAKRPSTIRRIHRAGTALLARSGCPTAEPQKDCREGQPATRRGPDGPDSSERPRAQPVGDQAGAGQRRVWSGVAPPEYSGGRPSRSRGGTASPGAGGARLCSGRGARLGQSHCVAILGSDPAEYYDAADLWPLDPEGNTLLMGIVE